MKINFEEKQEEVIFRISEFEPRYEPVFKMCFYEKDGDSYIARFKKPVPHLEKIESNYLRYAEEMFNQLGYFTEVPWEKALLAFIKRIEGKNINWFLTGSCACCVRGIPLNPHDVDIMIDQKDLHLIKDLFMDDMIEPLVDTNGWVIKDFGVLFLFARIDIASGPNRSLDEGEPVDCGIYASKHLESINYKGFEMKIPPIELSLNANRRRKRFNRVKLIEEYINQNK